jgi:hypothetical protein
MNTIEQVLSEARALAHDPEAQRLLGGRLGPLLAALEWHDRHARDAAEAAHRWATWPSKSVGSFERPSKRDGSLMYVATLEQGHNDPLLAARAASGMTETQVIEMQFVSRRDLFEQLIRRTELYTSQALILHNGVVVNAIGKEDGR